MSSARKGGRASARFDSDMTGGICSERWAVGGGLMRAIHGPRSRLAAQHHTARAQGRHRRMAGDDERSLGWNPVTQCWMLEWLPSETGNHYPQPASCQIIPYPLSCFFLHPMLQVHDLFLWSRVTLSIPCVRGEMCRCRC